MNNETLFLVDEDARRRACEKAGRKPHTKLYATELKKAATIYGRNPYCIAIVGWDDDEGFLHYRRAGFDEVIQMNHSRNSEMYPLVNRLLREVEVMKPRNVVIAGDDDVYQFLLRGIIDKKTANISIWTLSDDPGLYRDPMYNARPLSEVIPEPKTPKVDVRIDWDNIYIGLKKMGWSGTQEEIRTLVKGLRELVNDLGDIVNYTAYADWGVLQRREGIDFQRLLAEARVDTRYQISEFGKNSADMRIADDVRTVIETRHRENGPDTIVFITNDRDFRPVIETVIQRGHRCVLVGFERGMSRQLRNLATEVRYIDRELKLRFHKAPEKRPTTLSAQHSLALPLAKLSAWMHSKGAKGWRFAPIADIYEEVATTEKERADLKSLEDAGMLTRRSWRGREVLELNLEQPLTRVIHKLVSWAPWRIDHALMERGFAYVDSNWLTGGMRYDRTLNEMGLGTNRASAEQWLQLLAEADVIVPATQEHPKSPGKVITTWWLTAPEPAPTAPEEVESLEIVEETGVDVAESAENLTTNTNKRERKPFKWVPGMFQPPAGRLASAGV